MVRGFADLHNHQFAYLGFGGQAFWGRAFGTPDTSLRWCTPSHGPGGAGDIIGNAMKAMYGSSILGHKVGGFPQFDGWPRWDSVTHQSVHEEWLKRAVDGGLRLLVMLAVNNRHLASAANRAAGRSPDDMEAVDLQLAEARAMERYIDSKSGGPGTGWYRVVHSPEEALSAMEAGKLAVVLGVEVDDLFGATTTATVTPQQIDTLLDRYESLGLRHVFPIHFGDNGFGGTAFQNALENDPTALTAPAPSPVGVFYPVVTEPNPAYTYRGGRQNVSGLTPLGRHFIEGLMKRGMIIDVDHMSSKAKTDTFGLCQPRNYPVVAGHAGFNEICGGDKNHEGQLNKMQLEQIAALGGMVGVIVKQGDLDEISTWTATGHRTIEHRSGNTSNTIVQAISYAVSSMPGVPVAFGTDLNGFAGLPGPRFGPEAAPGGAKTPPPTNPLRYPFIAIATGNRMERSRTGQRTFDFNMDGLAHIGLLPDLVADFQAMGVPDAELEPLLQSAQRYVDIWFSASGRSARRFGRPSRNFSTAYDDFAVWRPSDGRWYVMDSANGTTRTQQWGTGGDIPVAGDFSGDGRTDFAVWRPADGCWYIKDAANGTTRTQQWGTRGDIPVAGDFSGDGRTDFAVWRPTDGCWYIKDAANGTTRTQQWGTRGDIPVAGDFSGDGRTDFAVWRPTDGCWYIKDAANGTTRTQQWGTRGDIPVAGDFSGDGRTDFAVWRPTDGTWWVMDVATGTTRTQQWGTRGDIPVAGDFSGDGRTDFAVWRPTDGTWWVMDVATGTTRTQEWGTKGDIPVAGDFSGDGRTDFAVWRPTDGSWYVLDRHHTHTAMGHPGRSSRLRRRRRTRPLVSALAGQGSSVALCTRGSRGCAVLRIFPRR